MYHPNWQYHGIFLGTILDKNSHVTTVPSSHIHNGLQPHESGGSFLKRISSLHLRKWELIVLPNQHIVVWPHLEAAGRPGPDLPPAELKKDLGHIFRKSAKGGHVYENTKECRALFIRVGSDYRNWIGTNVEGNDVFLSVKKSARSIFTSVLTSKNFSTIKI